MNRRIGIVTLSFGVLEEMMHLPEGHRIRGLRLNDSFTDTFEVAVEGPSLREVSEDQPIPRVTYQVTVTEEPELVPVRTFAGKFNEETRG